MAQGKPNKTKNPVEQLGFILNPEAEPDQCLEFLLVQFEKNAQKYAIFEVQGSPFRRCYYYLLVMSILAYRRLKWENHKGSTWPKNEPIGFPLPRDPAAKAMLKKSRPIFIFFALHQKLG